MATDVPMAWRKLTHEENEFIGEVFWPREDITALTPDTLALPHRFLPDEVARQRRANE